MTRKFCRGVGNTLFFWAEIPKSIFQEAYATDPFTGFFQGTGEGIKTGSKRLGFGLWETFTFFSPAGDRNYAPYIEPEFVMMDVKE
jgi:putative exosortase-associated protein (TIGR04073 family)